MKRSTLLMPCLAIFLMCAAATWQGLGTLDAVSSEIAPNTVGGKIHIIDASGAPVVDASGIVVFLESKGSAAKVAQGLPPVVVSQKDRIFSPHVLPIQRGQKVDYVNDDSIYHNVFSLSAAQPFDLGIYTFGTSRSVSFEKPGLVRVYCNIHPAMVANVLVLNNSLFDKTGKKGKWKITNVPDGQYKLRVWYEFGDEVSRGIKVVGGKVATHEITVVQTKKVKSHNNKFGKAYREKY